ncbi:MAG: UDP-N-acetylmuramoyl-L-alanyl-D-glutamate--2,6-diaminopimelate ligase [Patescibacteria group bacterium]
MGLLKKLFHFKLALLAYWWYGRPSRKLIVVGVTGTKGKSTTCRLISSVLEAGGQKVGMLSTVEFQIGEKRWLNDKKMTMLGRGEIQKMLKQMVQAGCRYVVVETSSQGILQYRHYGLNYDVVVFTNLAPEHVEAHGGFENLKRDKGIIFAQLMKQAKKVFDNKKVPKVAVVNIDDQHSDYYLQFSADEKFGFGIKNTKPNLKNITGKILASTETGSEFSVNNHNYHINILGDFNVYNALAAIAVAKSQNIPEEKIDSGLKNVKLIEGRMEVVNPGQDFKVIVDYAHEPLSLTELFTNLRKMLGPTGKLIGLVGSDGGGRDKSKREKMGEIAGRLCDVVIITDVNCFDEDPNQIAEMLAVGARHANKTNNENLFIEVDRRRAIEKAITMAKAGDIIAITAKGTEPCIVVANGKKIPWDDRQVAKEILCQ